MDKKLGKIFERLDELSTKDVLIFYLRNMKGMTLDEISKRVLMSKEGVRKRLVRIIKYIEDGISE